MKIRARILSFKYAFQGLKDLFTTQDNAKIHAFMMVLSLLLGWFFRLSTTEWCFIIFAISSVLAAEAFNTALEHITDLVSPEHHKLAGRTKDAAAGGVLLTALGAAIVGIIIFLPKCYQLLLSVVN
ncbi:MAG: diacylglycerol kinase family protein [Saprospiraceae bacterium]|nr:diacylglycerol kinase family protein [Saprospiraceae bacterium]